MVIQHDSENKINNEKKGLVKGKYNITYIESPNQKPIFKQYSNSNIPLNNNYTSNPTNSNVNNVSNSIQFNSNNSLNINGKSKSKAQISTLNSISNLNSINRLNLENLKLNSNSIFNNTKNVGASVNFHSNKK